MKNIKKYFLALLLILFFMSLTSAEGVLKFSLKYENSTISLENVSKINGYFKESVIQPENGYRFAILYKNGSEAFGENFNFPLEIIIEGAGAFKLDEADTSVYSLYSPDYSRFQVFSPDGKLVLDKELPNFESEKSYETQTRTISISPLVYYIIFFIIASLIILVIIFFILKKRKKS